MRQYFNTLAGAAPKPGGAIGGSGENAAAILRRENGSVDLSPWCGNVKINLPLLDQSRAVSSAEAVRM
jgi:hypothetical protein